LKLVMVTKLMLKLKQQKVILSIISRNMDPLEYWRSVQGTYPLLSRIGVRYLTIVGSSVPSERLFSRAGCILDPSRSRLTGSRLSYLLFLNSLDKAEWNI
jgi:hypothetical protein